MTTTTKPRTTKPQTTTALDLRVLNAAVFDTASAAQHAALEHSKATRLYHEAIVARLLELEQNGLGFMEHLLQLQTEGATIWAIADALRSRRQNAFLAWRNYEPADDEDAKMAELWDDYASWEQRLHRASLTANEDQPF